MDPIEKNMLIGAFVTGAVDLALEGYFMYQYGSGQPIQGQFPYQAIHPALPPYDDLIACAGTPLILYGLGKFMKKDSLKQMAKGGAIYGASELIGQTVFKIAQQTQTPAARYTIVR